MTQDPFFVPIRNVDDARTVITAVGELARRAGVELRLAPTEPVGCCGRGCTGCVWMAYFGAVHYWRECAAERLDRVTRSDAPSQTVLAQEIAR